MPIRNKCNALKHESSSKLLVYILALLVLKNSLFEMEIIRNFSLLFLKCVQCYHYSQQPNCVRNPTHMEKLH